MKPKLVTRGFWSGKPVAKERPRTIFRHGKSVTFTPPKTRDFEKMFKVHLLGGMKYPAIVIPVKTKRYMLQLTFILPIKSKIDLDNAIKSVADSGNGVVYVDDIQIDQIVAEKLYAAKGHGIHFSFYEI
jgi:Holliday junction resolvase RusA-like endonuclease